MPPISRIGAYTCAILMKTYGMPFRLGFAAGGLVAGAVRRRVRLLLRAAHEDLLRHADARLRADRLGDLLQMERRDRRRAGLSERAVSRSRLDDGACRLIGDMRAGDHFYLRDAGAGGAVLRRPAPHRRLAVRPHPQHASARTRSARSSSASTCARYELAAFVVAGAFAGLAGALFGIFNRGVFPDFGYWSKSAEVLIMTILGGMGHFWGPAVGAGGADPAQPADHLLHAVLAVHARHDPDRPALRLPRRASSARCTPGLVAALRAAARDA